MFVGLRFRTGSAAGAANRQMSARRKNRNYKISVALIEGPKTILKDLFQSGEEAFEAGLEFIGDIE